MAQLVINVGASPNDGQGDPIRTSFIKCNTNFSELYSRVQTSPPLTLVGSPGDVPGMYAYDENYFYYCFGYYDGSSDIWGQLSSESPSQLSSGTSNVRVGNSANITMSVAGTSNVVTVSTAGIDASNITLTGDLTAVNLAGTGNLSVTGVSNFTGNVTTGHILPAANITYDLGSPTAQWGNIYAGGNTIYLGDATLRSNATSMTLTTGSGAEFVIGGTGGNAEGTFGNLDVSGTITADNIDLTGDGDVAGNVTASYFIGDGSFLTNVTAFANVAATQIANGTSIINIDGLNGYVRVQVGGVSNVGVFTPTGFYVSGLADITGALTAGSITTSGNVIGGNISTAATVAGATIIANASTAATSTTTGSLRTAGGLGVVGNAHIGGLIAATGNITSGNLTTAGTVTTATISASGNITTTNGFVGANLSLSNQANITGTSNATSTTTGSLITAGGLGVAGNAFIGGIANVAGNINGANLNIDNQARIAYVDVVSRLDVEASAESTSTTTGAVIVTGGIGAGGNVYVGQQLVATGNVTGGNIITAGLVSTTSITKTGGNGTGNIGSSTNYFNTVFAKATSAQYADLAECYQSDAKYQSGTVVKFGGTQEVTVADRDHDPEIAGVVSKNPAYLMNTLIQGPTVVAVALVGRVPCQVVGPVRRGQMMVSAGGGRARAELNPAMGTVIGKALEDFDGEQGIIEIVVGRL